MLKGEKKGILDKMGIKFIFLFSFSAALHLGDTPTLCWRTESRHSDFCSQRKWRRKLLLILRISTGFSAWGGLHLILEPDNSNTTNKPDKLGLA